MEFYLCFFNIILFDFLFNSFQIQITIELNADIQVGLKLTVESKLIKGQPPIFTNQFVNLLFLSSYLMLKFLKQT